MKQSQGFIAPVCPARYAMELKTLGGEDARAGVDEITCGFCDR